jgi:predicted flap endonuclease-1-like 5' DNA nuclease
MDGVTAQTEKQLHELGFYRFKQIANLTDSQIDALRAESPEFKSVGWNLWRALLHIHGEPMATALARLRQGVPLEFADEAQVYQDTELGTLYRYKPDQVDSLSKIDGIDEEMERLLNGYGIWTFRQLAFLRAPQFVALRARNERLDGLRDTLHHWRSGSRCSVGSHWRWRSWELNEGDCPATDLEVDEAAPARLHQGDRLSLLPGVSGVGAVLLKDMGICQFEQIVQLTDEQIASFGMKYPCFKRLDPTKLRFAASRYLGQLVPRNGMPSDV